jgi:acetoin utilization deacetylase AcuC-like enzyme
MHVFTDPRCLAHRAPAGFPETAERLTGLLAACRSEPRFDLVETAAVSDDEVLVAARALHAPCYVDRLRRAIERGDGLVDTPDNPVGQGSWEAILGAAAATLSALDFVLGAPARRAFAAVRPPGHHAERDHAMGFCFFNQAALAAERALREHGLARVAIVDFDVHHGNGTQHLFEERADVLYVSLHQWPFYPGTGAAGERGRGAGEGATLNQPLAAGSGDREYAEAMRGTVLPALGRFAPELVIASAGFDAWRGDPLGGMRVSEKGFADWGDWLAGAAAESAGGRLLSVLEGGYDLVALPRLVRAYLTGEVEAKDPSPLVR